MSDLTSPLGFKSPGGERKRPPLGVLLSVLVAAVLVLLGLWVVLVDDPYGGEPVAVVKIEDVESVLDRSDIATVGVKSTQGELLPPVSGRGSIPGSEGIDSVTTPPAGVETEAPSQMPVVADPKLLQDGPYGPIPKIGEDGLRPVDAYARPLPAIIGSAPKIAIVVGGLGLSQAGTQEALKELPPDVTLAFAPYGTSLERWTAQARKNGHELLVQVPMEPFDYPDNDPGPHTLLTEAGQDKNLDRLYWTLARLGTYVGVMNYMGARFTSQAAAIDPVLADLGSRGLLFLDDGTSPRSETDKLALQRATPYAKADLVIDAVASPAEILGRLAQLEQIARTRGIAVGVASALPVSVKEIAAWAKSVDQRGITLVPISATQKSY